MFHATLAIMAIHVFYYFTANHAVVIFVAQSAVIVKKLVRDDRAADPGNISRKSERDFFKDNRFQIGTWCCIAAGTFTWVWSLCLMSEDVKFSSYYFSKVKPKTWPQYAIFYFICGFISAIESNCGHEMIHRRELSTKILGMFAFSKVFYTHFIHDHVEGHHKAVGTPKDPSTGRLNESVMAYMVREIYTTHTHTWQREVRRIQNKHGKDCPLLFLIIFNKMTLYFIIHVIMCLTIYLLLGWSSLRHQFIHAFVGLAFETFANYITHYGLIREKDKNGHWDPISKLNSWNFQTSMMFFRLGRHSDHHIAVFRPYQILRRFDEAPFNPYHFVICIYICWVPPLWYWVMNGRALAVRDFYNGRDNKIASFNAI